MKHFRTALSLLLCATLAAAPARVSITADTQAALDSVSPNVLKAHVSFLASDSLEGRDTPSRGLDVAAEYVAAQFRGVGLQPAGDDGYFQTANWLLLEQPLDGFELTVEKGGRTFRLNKESAAPEASQALELSQVPVVKLSPGNEVNPSEVQGKVVVLPMSMGQFRQYSTMRDSLRSAKPALLIVVSSGGPRRDRPARLKDPTDPPSIPSVTVRDADVFKAFSDLKSGPVEATASVRLPAPIERPAKLKNVIGVLPGSDPSLKDTYVLVTAHYDHVGMRPNGEGDRIFNGANDDASGTASVIEIASALSKLKEKPKRSIVFMAFFGEEKGLLGSRYYGKHPVFPVAKTVADVNLEQLGRTDAPEGSEVSSLTFTGFDYSDVPEYFKMAGEETGVRVWKHESQSDPFFARSDNQALADLGVPAHTVCVAYSYPDYHQPGDEWPKIDYANMAKVDRTLALGILEIAGDREGPRWNATNPKAEKYMNAWKALHTSAASAK